MQEEEKKAVNKPEGFASINLQNVKQLLYLNLMDIHPIVSVSHVY